jgi:NAD+ synthase (glutamine-hydrolysing)
MTTLNIVMAQMNTLVGDFSGNTTKVIESAGLAAQESAETNDNAQPVAVVVFPELTLCGYPPEDLLFREN